MIDQNLASCGKLVKSTYTSLLVRQNGQCSSLILGLQSKLYDALVTAQTHRSWAVRAAYSSEEDLFS